MPENVLIIATVCGGKQARICPVTNQSHDMSTIKKTLEKDDEPKSRQAVAAVGLSAQSA